MTRDETPRSLDAPHGVPAVTGVVTAGELGGARLHALVIGEKSVATYPLPDHGEVTIGRSPQCEILIDDASMSRSHARLFIGAQLAIADLGSANGTRVRERRLDRDVRVEIAAGEPVLVGNATLIVQRRAAPIRPRRLWTHDYFEVRLAEECARATRRGSEFAVMRVS